MKRVLFASSRRCRGTPREERGAGKIAKWRQCLWTASLVSAFLLIGVSDRVVAQSHRPTAITIEQAVQEAIENNLSLLAERYNLSIAEAKMITARLRPNPVVSMGGDHLDWLGTGFNEQNGAGPPEYFIRTDFLIERGGKRRSRIEVAEQAREVARWQLLNATRTIVLEVQMAFVDVLLAKSNLALAEENLRLFNQIVQVNAARVNAGDLAPVELTRTRLAALQLQNAVMQAQSRLRLARQRLQGLMGRTVLSETFDVIGELRRDLVPVSLEVIEQQALNLRPDLQALKREQARALAEVRLQLAYGKADYSFGIEVRRQQGIAGKGNSIGVFFSLPLPIFNRNQGEIERARQELAQIEARLRALEADIRNEVRSAFQQCETARSLLTTIEADMLQQARQVLRTMEYSYRRGEASFVELLDAQRAFNDTMQSYNEARAEYARCLYLIDSISGKGLNQ